MTCRYLAYEDRKKLEALYDNGTSLTAIAAELGVHLATIYRELARGATGELNKSGRSGYNAEQAQKAVLSSIKNRGCRKTSSMR